ncbi:Bro-N domain-containing protein [Haemophilus parahaemolyticus]|uniref:BRO-N domain-containing protein n=1 Tax=Haemophilus parahaemolyticus TaxID=735 RepID=UPI0028F11862|nr:Bro-N domain-containing protein [Haemophilus parahaemolyticus]
MTTQNQLSTFNFENQSIRTIAINNEPWFIAKDLCDAINISNYRDAIERLDEDEKGVALTDTLGGKQEMAVVSESGMYTLILRCRDAVKKGSIPHRFRKWVTAEVLPQIRKTGSYSQNVEEIRPLEITLKVQMLDNLYYMAKNASELCHQYRKMMNDIINTLNIEYFRPSKPDYKYQLVSDMQFALDDVEVILKTHTREQTAKNIELARLRRSF